MAILKANDGTTFQVGTPKVKDQNGNWIIANDPTANAKAELAYNEGYEAGKQAGYDKFWDSFQENGNRTNYSYAFGGRGWNDSIFKPKYPINIVNSTEMFINSNLKSLEGVVIDTSNMYACSKMFQGCSFTNIPEINISKVIYDYNVGYAFSSSQIRSIEKIIVSENTPFVASVFANSTNLTHAIFEGVLAKNGLNMSMCTLLNKASLTSIINCLSTTTTGLTVTLSLTAVNNAFEGGRDGEEWQTLIATKSNWTIAYA